MKPDVEGGLIFAELGATPVQFEGPVAVVEGTGVTHLRYRVRNRPPTVGIVPAAVSLLMPFLSYAQCRAGRGLSSASAVADSKRGERRLPTPFQFQFIAHRGLAASPGSCRIIAGRDQNLRKWE